MLTKTVGKSLFLNHRQNSFQMLFKNLCFSNIEWNFCYIIAENTLNDVLRFSVCVKYSYIQVKGRNLIGNAMPLVKKEIYEFIFSSTWMRLSNIYCLNCIEIELPGFLLLVMTLLCYIIFLHAFLYLIYVLILLNKLSLF